MDVRDGFIGTIGNTPLIRLAQASEATGCEILGKAEFLNPGGSVKDRAAWGMVRDAERTGRLAVESDPADPWSVHAVAHVLEMRDRRRDGIAWLRKPAATLRP